MKGGTRKSLLQSVLRPLCPLPAENATSAWWLPVFNSDSKNIALQSAPPHLSFLLSCLFSITPAVPSSQVPANSPSLLPLLSLLTASYHPWVSSGLLIFRKKCRGAHGVQGGVMTFLETCRGNECSKVLWTQTPKSLFK